MMTLVSAPDAKLLAHRVTVGNRYTVIRQIGNGSVVMSDDWREELLILTSRFEESK